MKKQKNKRILAYLLLVTLITSSLLLTYIKFFSTSSTDNKNIKEIPVNESSSIAIHTALQEIVNNFNESPNVEKYEKENNETLDARVNNYSIFISNTKDTTTTYEFRYDNLNLSINVLATDQEQFEAVLKFLVEAVQKRINNTENIDKITADFLQNDTNYDGLTKEKKNDIIEYKINITQKLRNS